MAMVPGGAWPGEGSQGDGAGQGSSLTLLFASPGM